VFVVTGGAGFIGSHLAERLLRDQPRARVRILDNFSTGRPENLPFVAAAGDRLEIVRGDIRDLATVERVAAGATTIFHQAAMRSVPRSVADPLGANDHNVNGTLNVLEAARRAGVKRVVYASSSSVYGDRPELPKREDQPLAPISPYAVSKAAGEQYAAVWHRLYGVETVGLRYFNVFGPRQDPSSQYSGVLSRFCAALLAGAPPVVFGDGEQSRDFTYVANVVDATLRACDAAGASGKVFNVGTGKRYTLNETLRLLGKISGKNPQANYDPPRAGDIRDSQADISLARKILGYNPTVGFEEGLRRTWEWYAATYKK
jgi:UDP-glucose 4-epimerase